MASLQSGAEENRTTIDLRPVAHLTGQVVLGLGVLMIVPAVVDALLGDPNADDMATAAGITILSGLGLALATGSQRGKGLDTRQAFLLTLTVWFSLSAFGALPFVLGAPGLRWIDALFESVSGITTTGSTVIVGLDNLPAGMNLWRGMLNGVGGLGIAFVAMIFLPVMRIGGMQFFRTEGFDTLGKVMPRATDIAAALLRVYLGLILACTLTYLALGQSPLDATVHGIATIATGGFSPTDASFTKYQGASEYAGALFMVLGAMPYIRFVQMIGGQPGAMARDPQARAFVIWLIGAICLVTLWRVASHGAAVEPSFRETLFNLTSVMTGTGFFSGSFGAWGGFALAVAFTLGLCGGCSGSSSGAMTVFRVKVILTAVAAALRRIANPSRIAPVRYDGRPVPPDAMAGIIFYANGYLVTLGVLSVALTLTGADAESALFAIWTSMGNIGYGVGTMVARTGTFVDFTNEAKAVMILAMLMGRLGLLAVFVVFLPRFWRD